MDKDVTPAEAPALLTQGSRATNPSPEFLDRLANPPERPLDTGAETWNVRCTAHSSRTGEPCKKYAIIGGNVCSTHGGSAPAVKEAARRRIAQLVPGALNVLAEIMLDPEAKEASRVRAADSILDRAGLKAVDVSINVSSEDANAALDAQIAAALSARFDDPEPEDVDSWEDPPEELEPGTE